MKHLLKIIIIISISICCVTLFKSCKKITEPEVTTSFVTDINSTSATSGGNVTNNGGAKVTTRGVCWGTTVNPTIDSNPNKTTDGTGNGTFSSTITNLSANTQYHVRAYATNSEGTGYGDDVSFITYCDAPSAPVIGTITQPTCAVPTGSVVLNGLPSTGTWTLTRTPGGTTTTGSGISTTISGLAEGITYTFTVTNSTGCISESSGNIVIYNKPLAPSATTDAAPSVGTTTATLKGTVNANNSQTTVSFEYGTGTNYGSTINATPNQVTGDNNTSVFAELTGLTPNTEYHYRIKAVNCAGTNSGSDVSFTTTSGCQDSYEPNNTLAAANTTAFGNLGSVNYSNTINGTIDVSSDVDVFRLNISTTGIITITSYSPGADRDITLYNSNGETIDYSVHGFEETIIYPITTAGNYYISVWGGVQSCLTYNLSLTWGPGSNTGTFKDYRDGQEYRWVYIGHQFWMAENLNIGTRINGSQNQTNNGVIEKYCYNDNLSNCQIYGGLYQWDEMMQYSEHEMASGVCPVDWHIPSDSEWKTLELTLGMSRAVIDTTGWRGTDEGGKLKSTSALWDAPNTGATNASGFTALPSGNRNSGGTFDGIGSFTDFWTSTFDPETGSIWYRLLDSEHATIYRTRGNRQYGTPLRCVKD